MNFGEKLNEYIELLDCTAKQISEASGISASTISRYRSGATVPERNSEQFEKITLGISSLAKARGIAELTHDAVKQELSEALGENDFDYEKLRNNVNALISTFSISITDLANELNYDRSHLTRIRTGERRAGDPQRFVNTVAGYVVNNYSKTDSKILASKLMSCELSEIETNASYFEQLVKWLTSGYLEVKYTASDFLKKIDEFDLNEYIRAIHFDEMKLPSVPFQLPTSKKAMTIKDMMNIELDFIKATVLSKSDEPVIMYSDMPISEMAKDSEFAKKWMFGIAMMIKKGLHLNQIHNIDRSFEEMMLGIEGWLPLYMTGQVSPYYLRSPQNSVFNHFLKVSGSAALWGEAIANHHKDGMLYLTKQKDEVKYYKTHAQQLLKKALPLMDVYNENFKSTFESFLEQEAEDEGVRRSILCTPPVYTMSEELLESFLASRGVAHKDKTKIKEYTETQRRLTEKILSHSPLNVKITVLSKEEFEKHPPVLSLAGMFYESDLKYSYEEYVKHLEQTKSFSQTHTSFTVCETYENAFRNIQINIYEGKWVIVSKEKSPVIHFVIKHPKLRGAIENMIIPVYE